MINVIIDIEEHEIEVVFSLLKGADDEKYWKGELSPGGSGIIIPEKDSGFDLNTIQIPPEVTTPLSILFERFELAHKKFQDQVSAGLEPLDEENKTSEIIPYNPDEIKVRRETFSVFEINRMIAEQKDIDLNPEFQRNLVWDNSRKSALIESILLGIPIPVFYFAESKVGTYHVVDGLQRLSTIVQYLDGDFPLKKLEHLKECEGKYYKETKEKRTIGKTLERRYSRRLENAQLVVNVIESKSPQKVKYDIFKRLNTGGRPLNQQEVRNCIAEQTVRKYLKTAAESPEFKTATGGSVSDVRMDAQELVLRFTGFKLEREGLISYSGDMNSFLDDVLDILNDLPDHMLRTYRTEFLRSMRINFHLFGKYCFRKVLPEHLQPSAKKQYINKALFVTWSIEVLALNESIVKNAVPSGSLAYNLAETLDRKGKYYTILTTGTSDKQNLKDASNFAKDILRENSLL